MVEARFPESVVPAQYLASARAPAPRTLRDILLATAAEHPSAAAIDDGTVTTYSELIDAIRATTAHLHSLGLGRGARIGVRLPSGDKRLYLAILSTLHAGAAYVPVDADDPEERAELVFGEADVDAVWTDSGIALTRPIATPFPPEPPRLDDDAWIIFTSGSTGKPKGVAVTHRSAAAFVDAEARWFLADAPGGPLGVDDRVLAGLSVAFDASCEEMWLAFGHGACLVPAPRALVRSGMDLGPWLISREITVVSTVPTLVGLWPDEALDHVRLLIVGGEACPQELIERYATDSREMWNTYGPTEATVVACGTRLHPGSAVNIGLPLDGWDLAVVDAHKRPVALGEVGELIIGGVGLARYLDQAKDTEKYAPFESLGWDRAYATGDHVRLEADGLYFVGRMDDQVKIGGRRIELGEVDAGLSAVDNVRSSTVVVQRTGSGDSVLVGYVSLEDPARGFDPQRAHDTLAAVMPAALVPRIHVMDELPVTTAGKVDKRALPWPLPAAGNHAENLSTTQRWLADLWAGVLGVQVDSVDADFFSLGGTSLAAATLVGAIRERVPTVAVRDLYDRPRLEVLAEFIDSHAALGQDAVTTDHGAHPPSGTPGAPTQAAPGARRRSGRQLGHRERPGGRFLQSLAQLPLRTLQAGAWMAWVALVNTVCAGLGMGWAHPVSWWVVVLALLIFVTPVGRIPLGVAGARLLTAGMKPGRYPRGGRVHLRLWAAERLVASVGLHSVSGATWVVSLARLLGAKVGKGVDLHTLPPVTGLLRVGAHAAIEPEVDLSGYWIDGDELVLGSITIGADARIGARSVLLPGAVIGAGAHIEAGSTVTGAKKVKAGARWAGSPARKVGRPKHRFPEHRPPQRPAWVAIYAVTALLIATLPLTGVAVSVATVIALAGVDSPDLMSVVTRAVPAIPAATIAGFGTYMTLGALTIRVLGRGIQAGVAPVRSSTGWRVWTITRLMDDARTYLFPLYAAQLTPLWLRLLGARIGKDTEISTAVGIPQLMTIRDGAFLADDTMVAGYELGGGWIRTGRVRIGKRSFLGNSGIAGPERKLGKNSLVAVLSSAPKRAKAGSNWWGSPPERLRRVAQECSGSDSTTYRPTLRLKIARGCWETLRLLAPMTSLLLAVGVGAAMSALAAQYGLLVAWLAGGVLLIVAGVCAMLVTAAVKWLCVGRIRAGDHPLWSSFVWRNELQDAFVETVAAPWFFNHNQGTTHMNVGLRLLGAHIGRGAWMDSYWLPEADLCHIGQGAHVGPGCVVQTHLFHDRVMSLDTVTLDPDASLSAHSFALPSARLGRGATVAPGSLVMRGEHVPAETTWQGNPIEPQIDGAVPQNK